MSSVIAFMDDLMFLSRVREAAKASALEVRPVGSPEALLEACHAEPPSLVVVDLDGERLRPLQGVRALRADDALAGIPVVGFVSHVEGGRAREAQEAGCTKVLARSAFVRELPGLLERPSAPKEA